MRATRAFERVTMVKIAITFTFLWRWFLASFMLGETSILRQRRRQTQKDSRQRVLHSQTYAYLQRLSHRGLPPPYTRANVYTQHLHTHKNMHACIQTLSRAPPPPSPPPPPPRTHSAPSLPPLTISQSQGCQCILRQRLTSLPASAIHSITIRSVAAISHCSSLVSLHFGVERKLQ